MAAAPNQQQLFPASSRTENQAIQDSRLLSFAVLSLQRGGRCQSPALYSTPSALTGTLGCGGDGRCSPSGWASCRSRPYCDSCDPQEKYSQKSFRSCFSIRLNSRHWHKPKAQQRPLVLLAVWKGKPNFNEVAKENLSYDQFQESVNRSHNSALQLLQISNQ